MNPNPPAPAAMDLIIWTYALYLLVSVALTVWVAKTLHKNGRILDRKSTRLNSSHSQ